MKEYCLGLKQYISFVEEYFCCLLQNIQEYEKRETIKERKAVKKRKAVKTVNCIPVNLKASF